MHERFLMKVVGKLGPGEEDTQELRVLNRVLRWTEKGVTYEADPRHAEILVAGLLGGSRPVTTPGTAAMKSSAEGEKDNEIEDDSPLEGEEVGLFRS